MSNNDHQMTPKNEQPGTNHGQGRTFSEELEVTGSQLVERVRELIEEGTARRLIIRNAEGRTLLEIPLSFGAVASGALLLFNPVLAGLTAMGALVAQVKIEIIRQEPDAIEQDVKEGARNAQNKPDDFNKNM